MTAAKDATKSDNPATSPAVALRVAVFDDLTAGLGATNDTARAKLLGVDRATIHRYRTRQFEPSMGVAMRMAALLHTTVDHLFEQVTP